MQHTLAFAPTPEDLEEFFFDIPLITQAMGPEPADREETTTPAEAHRSP